MFVFAVPEMSFTLHFVFTLSKRQTLPNIPRFQKFVLISSPFAESSEMESWNHETYILSHFSCLHLYPYPLGNVCLGYYWEMFYFWFWTQSKIESCNLYFLLSYLHFGKRIQNRVNNEIPFRTCFGSLCQNGNFRYDWPIWIYTNYLAWNFTTWFE